jgi:hypothetical protein
MHKMSEYVKTVTAVGDPLHSARLPGPAKLSTARPTDPRRVRLSFGRAGGGLG